MEPDGRTNDDVWVEAVSFEERRLDLLARVRAGTITRRQWWAAQHGLAETTSLQAQMMATRMAVVRAEYRLQAAVGEA